MLLTIKKSLGWKNVFLKQLNANNRVIKTSEIKFLNNEAKVQIDENKTKLIYFTNGSKRTETIVLSSLTLGLELRFNRKTKRYDCLIFVPNVSDYGSVDTHVLKDQNNLPIAKNNSKVINVLKPANYDPNKEYGLIIMIDGQNMFTLNNVGKYTKKNDPYNGWQLDVSLKALSTTYNDEEYIVAGVETTGMERMVELCLSPKEYELKDIMKKNFKDMPFGLLKFTEKFIINTVLPFIKSTYKIRENRIGIGGSSAGGLSSYYIGLNNYKIFDFIIPYSNAIGIYKEEVLKEFYDSLDFRNNLDKLPSIHSYIGKKGALEKSLYLAGLETFVTLVSAGYNKELITHKVVNSLEHNEILWRYAFLDSLNEIAIKHKKS